MILHGSRAGFPLVTDTGCCPSAPRRSCQDLRDHNVNRRSAVRSMGQPTRGEGQAGGMITSVYESPRRGWRPVTLGRVRLLSWADDGVRGERGCPAAVRSSVAQMWPDVAHASILGVS